MLDIKLEHQKIVKFIKENLKDHKAVIGISGGKDSLICAALCVEALGVNNVLGILMPNRLQADINDSISICEFLGIKYQNINISKIYDDFIVNLNAPTTAAVLNIAPRIRMTLLYAIAQSVSGRVICTSNLSEAFVGWTTKFGDNVGDIAPILHLTKTEVCALGDELNLPHELVYKAPADGLTNKSDEANLGFTYEELDTLIRNPDTQSAHREAILERHEMTRHKREPVLSLL